jgi:hypothetical protein
MKRFLIFAALVAISTIGAQAHIGWDLATCIQKYGEESQPLKRGNAGETHYFSAGDMGISVVLRNDKVKSIFYRKISGKTFSPDETAFFAKRTKPNFSGAKASNGSKI